jgi:hypothetical protein
MVRQKEAISSKEGLREILSKCADIKLKEYVNKRDYLMV